MIILDAMRVPVFIAMVLGVAIVAVACSASAEPGDPAGVEESAAARAPAPPPVVGLPEPVGSGPAMTAPATTVAATTTTTTTTTISPFVRPLWLGTRVLELRADGFGVARPTPADLIDRRLATPLVLAPPASGGWESSIGPVPAEVLARSSWHDGCPVPAEDLAYITMSHWGFDGQVHTGEMIVNGRVAENVTAVFSELFQARFPIEEMRVVTAAEVDAPPTGDGNVTGSFACRDAVNTGKWSQHAYGLAIDINPFHNPYVKGDLILPELASYYVDRDLALPGMVDTTAVAAFASIGWKWGGNWNSLKDWMHFSESGH